MRVVIMIDLYKKDLQGSRYRLIILMYLILESLLNEAFTQSLNLNSIFFSSVY